MGTDKAVLAIDGRALARRVADALAAGGVDSVVAIGGDRAALGAAGLEVVDDEHPGAGPLAAIATALGYASQAGFGRLVVCACDHPDLDGGTVRALLSALDDPPAGTAIAHPLDRSGAVPLLLAFAVGAAAPVAADAVARGDRSVRALLGAVATVAVEGLAASALADVDRPEELRGRYGSPTENPTDRS